MPSRNWACTSPSKAKHKNLTKNNENLPIHYSWHYVNTQTKKRERVIAHLPEYSTLKSFRIFSPKRFEPECSSSVVGSVRATTEEEHSGSKRLGEKYSKTFQCAVPRQMGIDTFTQYLRISLPCDSWLLLNSRRSHPKEAWSFTKKWKKIMYIYSYHNSQMWKRIDTCWAQCSMQNAEHWLRGAPGWLIQWNILRWSENSCRHRWVSFCLECLHFVFARNWTHHFMKLQDRDKLKFVDTWFHLVQASTASIR